MQGTSNDYAGATYAFTRPDASGEAVTLTVKDSNSNTLNTIEFTTYPSSGYTFYTRDTVGSDTDITATLPAVPPRQDGSEQHPFLATAAADSFTGSAGADWVSYAGATDTRGVWVDLSTAPVTVLRGATGDTLMGINNLVGSDYIDVLTGNSGVNILRGGAGDDWLMGNEGADILDGGAGAGDIVQYRASAEGVRVSLLLQGQAQINFDGSHGFTANNNDAVGDILSNIENIYGSFHNDWLTGDGNDNELWGRSGDDRLEGGAGVDTYQFNSGDGTDTIVDDGGKIVFSQGTGNDYAGATYTFTRPDASGAAVTLTVKDSNSNTLNVIEFTTYPSSGYTFYTRETNDIDTDITATLPAVPPRQDGSESNPFLATDGDDTFTGSTGADWVSYAGSTDTNGVQVGIRYALATVSGGAAGDTLTNINNLIGSDHDDTLTGNSGVNILRGGAGKDHLNGEAGADILDGGEGHDLVAYSFSPYGVRVNLLLQGQAQEDFDGSYGFTANQGGHAVGDVLSNIEEIYGSRLADWLTGDANDNILTGDFGDDRLEGGAGEDILRGHSGEDTLEGGAGRDSLVGGGGADILDGGAGVDTASYHLGVRVNLALTGAQEDFDGSHGFAANQDGDAVGDILSNIENIRGSIYDDWLTGDGNDNSLYGGGGNDRLEGGAGVDTYEFYANHGTDTIVDDGGKIVFERGTNLLGMLNDDYYAGATYTFTRADEGRSPAVTLTVKDSNDITINTIEFTTYPASGYTFYTRDTNGIETEIPASSLVVPLGVEGTESNPYLATAGDDSFTGSAGADWVSYAGTTDISGVTVDLRYDPAITSSGAAGDTLTGINNLVGSNYNDNLHGNSGDNILRGGAGYDILRGGGGADTLDGGSGSEDDLASYDSSVKGVRVSLLLQGQAQEDFDGSHGFTANQGGDAVGDILSNIEEIQGSSHGDWLTGDDKDNTLYGREGNDRLEGGGGIDTLYGETGDDTLQGGEGADTLDGGAGADTYIFESGDGTDTIVDDGGKIVFYQRESNDYAGATYTFTRADGGRSEAVTLTVTKGGNTINIIEFTTDPSSGYTFYTRDFNGIETEIPASSLVVPLGVAGTESNPFLATDA